MKLQNANIALVYDRVNTPFGGAENVLLALHELFPNAPLFTSVYDPHHAVWAKDFEVRPSFLQHFPFAKTHHRELVMFMPKAFESFDLSRFDLVISISSAEAKGVLTHANQLHICYLLTPTRYLWSHIDEYSQGYLGPIKSAVFNRLRSWDLQASTRPNQLFAISKVVADRAKKYYKRKVSQIIYPPFSPLPTSTSQSNETLPYFLIVSRLVAYKHIDRAIQASIQENFHLKIVGDGPELQSLQQLVNQHPNHHIEFLRNVTRTKLSDLYTQATAFLLPNEEDFGIAALEAMSVGTPVITQQTSGVAELIKHHKSGILLPDQQLASLTNAMHQAQKIDWSKKDIAHSVMEYNKESFQKKFFSAVDKAWNEHQKSKK